MTPSQMYRLAQDRKDAIDALVERWERAYNQNHTPSRRPSKAGVKVTGNSDDDITYSDPVGQTAAILTDELDRISDEMAYRRQADYQLAARLEEFAPARSWDDGMRRCDAENCAKPHKALGLCEAHYKAAKRVEERRAS